MFSPYLFLVRATYNFAKLNINMFARVYHIAYHMLYYTMCNTVGQHPYDVFYWFSVYTFLNEARITAVGTPISIPSTFSPCLSTYATCVDLAVPLSSIGQNWYTTAQRHRDWRVCTPRCKQRGSGVETRVPDTNMSHHQHKHIAWSKHVHKWNCSISRIILLLNRTAWLLRHLVN